jgi:hypothetical protein
MKLGTLLFDKLKTKKLVVEEIINKIGKIIEK